MPRQAKPARLWLKPADAKTATVWIIKDGAARISTGCGPGARTEAEAALVRHISSKHDARAAAVIGSPLEDVDVADVLTFYLEDVALKSKQAKKAHARVLRLMEWWGDKTLADITSDTCAAYAKARASALRPVRLKRDGTPYKAIRQGGENSTGGARRDLEDLRAAVAHHAGLNLHRGVVEVALPSRGKARHKYLTRDEVAAMVWYCWRHRREQVVGRGPRKGQRLTSGTFYDMRHIARFILLGVYTGSRSTPLLRASIYPGPGRAFLDLAHGLYHRLPEDFDEAANKKSPTARIPRSLLAHLRRWRDKGVIASHVVEWNGKPIGTVKTAWARVVAEAVPGGIRGDPVPHTMRHSCVTWLKQQGISSYDVGNYVGMSEQMVENVYGKYDPEHQSAAVDAMSAARRRTKSPDRNRTETPSSPSTDTIVLLRKIEELQQLINGSGRS